MQWNIIIVLFTFKAYKTEINCNCKINLGYLHILENTCPYMWSRTLKIMIKDSHTENHLVCYAWLPLTFTFITLWIHDLEMVHRCLNMEVEEGVMNYAKCLQFQEEEVHFLHYGFIYVQLLYIFFLELVQCQNNIVNFWCTSSDCN